MFILYLRHLPFTGPRRLSSSPSLASSLLSSFPNSIPLTFPLICSGAVLNLHPLSFPLPYPLLFFFFQFLPFPPPSLPLLSSPLLSSPLLSSPPSSLGGPTLWVGSGRLITCSDMEELARGFSNESDYSSPAAPGAQGREVTMAGQQRGPLSRGEQLLPTGLRQHWVFNRPGATTSRSKLYQESATRRWSIDVRFGLLRRSTREIYFNPEVLGFLASYIYVNRYNQLFKQAVGQQDKKKNPNI